MSNFVLLQHVIHSNQWNEIEYLSNINIEMEMSSNDNNRIEIELSIVSNSLIYFFLGYNKRHLLFIT